ncbi:MAG: helix-turn-helix domain-containing protein [Chlorobi bacterium]|nr:helix-turn-helix domain-containing protein [Chlorobiota bacterium]
MVVIRTYKTLLLPNEEQLQQLQTIAHGVKLVWNWALAERIRAYQLKGETIWQEKTPVCLYQS